MSDSDRYVLVCNEEACKAEIKISDYTDSGWGSALNDDGNVRHVCPDHFARCNGCGRKKKDTTLAAYLIDRSRKTGLCADCAVHFEKEDIDSYTHDALSKLCNIVNGRNAKDLAESMFRSINREHRYLQAELFSAFAQFFKMYGEQDEGHRDARNEWAVFMAKRWDKVAFDHDFPVD